MIMHSFIIRNRQVVIQNQIKHFHTNLRFQTKVGPLNDQDQETYFMEIKVQKLTSVTTFMIISDCHSNVDRTAIIITIFR